MDFLRAICVLYIFFFDNSITFANLLPKETYGSYKYILSILGILAIPTLTGMEIAVTRCVAKGYERSFLPFSLKQKLIWNSNKPNGTPRKLLNIDRLRNLGWKHKTELKQGIKNTYEWYTKSKAR